MGASPSVRQFQDMMDMLLASWQRFPVGAARDTLEAWRATVYIDDLQAFVAGGFANALRLVAEMVVLGFTINLKPTQCHIGFVWNALTMQVCLPASRVEKLANAVAVLRASVVGTTGRPPALLVAKLIGLLWAAHMCMPRAVAICCLGLIHTLSVLLRSNELRDAAREQKFFLLKFLLNGVWRGTVTWTSSAETDLSFCESIDFAMARCNIAYRCLDPDFVEWCWAPTTSMHHMHRCP